MKFFIDGLVQDNRIAIFKALEIPQSYNKPSICRQQNPVRDFVGVNVVHV